MSFDEDHPMTTATLTLEYVKKVLTHLALA